MNRPGKKIVVLGPESTGKSTLCKRLAEHYKTSWVPEYAREYLEHHGLGYDFDSLLTIAKGQVALEEEYIGKLNASSTLFIDTDQYVLKVWAEFVYGKCHSWILNQAAMRNYDLYLLCNVDLPWVKDGLREYPDLLTRKTLYKHYLDIMINQPVPWIDISGTYDERFEKAVTAIDCLL